MQPKLQRRLGAADAAALVVSNVIGVGIFTTPGIVCGMLPRPGAILAVWALGGFLALSGAMAYAELAALKPRAGGEYVYLREGFGRLAAFLTGWTSFVAGFSGAIAAGAIGLTSYLGRFVPAAADPTPIWSVLFGRVSVTLSRPTIVALAIIVALGAVHVRGIRPGSVVQDSLAAAQVFGLVLFVVLGFTLGKGSLANLAGGARPPPSSWLLALIPVMFSYSGWNAAAYVAEEVRQPGESVPRALVWGTTAVIAIYLGLNALYLYVLPVTELSGRIDAADVVAARLFGPIAAAALAVLAILIILASLSAMTLAGPRIGTRPPPVRNSGGRDRGADGVELSSRPFGDFRAAPHLHGVCDRSLLCRRRLRSLRVAVEDSGGAPAFPGLGLPDCARDLRPRELRDRRQCNPGSPRSVGDRTSGHGRRDPALLADAAAGAPPLVTR
ncbi:MAG: hypothetical protein DMF54_16030 [Acidobacteria bacterium]|nr:MAG: hypothetical protein DMF54_16030 [Acidobacteriota bacterium]